MIARARGQRQTRDDISLIFNAILRSRRVARVSPARNTNAAQQAKPVCVSKPSQRASNLGLEICASVLLYSRTDI
ncbi:MAG: hypothetical protein WAN68_16655, partial [Pseudolabrys sp.]